MASKINQIKKLVKAECRANGLGWFYDVHLVAVENCAKLLLEKLPKADKEIVMLGVWLHDLQRVRGIEGDHVKIGALEAKKVMREFNYPRWKIEALREIVLSHSCQKGLAPKTLEGKILATADAMSHFTNDFSLEIAVTGRRDVKGFKKWALEKIERDYHKKIFFPFAKKIVAKHYRALKEFLTMGG